MPGLLYNKNNVVVGQAVGYIAADSTALVADSVALFDGLGWSPWTINQATSTYTVTINGITSAAVTTTGTVSAAQAIMDTAFGVGNVIVGGIATALKYYPTNALQGKTVTATGTSNTVVAPLWTPLGGTEQGWKATASKTTNTINIEEQSTPVAELIQSQTFGFDANLSEITARTLQIAYNTTKAVVAVASGVTGKTTLAFTDSVTSYAVCLETINELGLATRLYVPSAVALQNTEQTFRRAANQQLLPVSFMSICPPSLIQEVHIDAVALP